MISTDKRRRQDEEVKSATGKFDVFWTGLHYYCTEYSTAVQLLLWTIVAPASGLQATSGGEDVVF